MAKMTKNGRFQTDMSPLYRGQNLRYLAPFERTHKDLKLGLFLKRKLIEIWYNLCGQYP